MTEQETRELCKALAYDVSKEEIADMYGVTVADVEKLAEENAAIVEEIKNHYAKMG
jgi:hypothetical protein